MPSVARSLYPRHPTNRPSTYTTTTPAVCQSSRPALHHSLSIHPYVEAVFALCTLSDETSPYSTSAPYIRHHEPTGSERDTPSSAAHHETTHHERRTPTSTTHREPTRRQRDTSSTAHHETTHQQACTASSTAHPILRQSRTVSLAAAPASHQRQSGYRRRA